MFLEIMKGMATTLKHAFQPPVTVQYPEVKRPVPERFKGRHELKRYDNGLEKCIGCSLCAAACPADAIFVEAAENVDAERYSPGERYASTYEINMLRCIFCGYCEDACPTEAIVLERNYELSFYDRASAIYTKEMLLVSVPEAGQDTPQEVEPGQFDRSIPEMEDPKVGERYMGDPIIFLSLAAIAVFAGLGMVFSRNAVHSALFLILNLCTVAVLYLVLNAPFLAMVQITVYAGAIMVLFLFVIMLLGAEQVGRGEESGRRFRVERYSAIVLGLLLLAGFLVVLLAGDSPASPSLPVFDASPTTLGLTLFEAYVLPFEITAVLLLVAMIGVVVLSRLKKKGR